MTGKPRIGVSACIVGHLVRYSGGHCRDIVLMRDIAPHVELVPMCPEVESGLGAPRESMHLEGTSETPRLVSRESGTDETARLTLWSRERVRRVDSLELDGFVLKKGSPTCGMERVRVYPSPDARPSYDGVGVFARELMARWPQLAVEEEGRLHDEGLREHFVTRVFASHRWRRFAAETPDLDELTAFHRRNELLVLAHEEVGPRDLERLLAEAREGLPIEEASARYGARFLRALGERPTRESQSRVLRRLLDEARSLTRDEEQDLADVLQEYLQGRVPLTVPARLLLHHVRADSPWAAGQTWFAPWPREILLRTQVTAERAREPTLTEDHAIQEVSELWPFGTRIAGAAPGVDAWRPSQTTEAIEPPRGGDARADERSQAQ